ncbi:hypothetical protein HID58_094598 [Brassica napus]|uniref:Magnesium transporter n=1 Tax=Brassica napus TaxID=3708 RepID=A0ABQ7X8F7_BRANA|nr:hypothetical protein HID58_094598 [Brassica napus]
MNPNASVYLLQQLVHRWIDHSILISSTDAMKQFIQQLFMVSLTLLAGEGMPVVLAKDARAIAIWCLMGTLIAGGTGIVFIKQNIKVGRIIPLNYHHHRVILSFSVTL